jgi:hypothetical protein
MNRSDRLAGFCRLGRLASTAFGAALFFSGSPLHGELLVYEPFEYNAGTILDGVPATGANLTGDYTPLGTNVAQKIVVSAPGLTYGNLINAPSAVGQKADDANGVTAAGATALIDQDVAIAAGSAIYFSALFTFDDSTNGNRHAFVTLRDDASGDEIVFGQTAVGSRAIRVSADTVATGQLVAGGADGSFVDGSTLFLIGRYINAAAADGDQLQLIGYSTAEAHVLPAAFDPADPQAEFSYGHDGLDIDMTAVTSITFTIRGDGNNFIDELRVGTAYADIVVPEPAAIAVIWPGLAIVAFRRLRSR